MFFEPPRLEAAAEQLNVKDYSLNAVRLRYQLFEPRNVGATPFRFARRAHSCRDSHVMGVAAYPERKRGAASGPEPSPRTIP